VKNKLFVSDHHGMSGVIPALVPHNHIGFFREKINDLSLSFISPLCANNHRSRHSCS